MKEPHHVARRTCREVSPPAVGGWSARHKKSVLAGWLVFVVAPVDARLSCSARSKLTKADQFTGQSGKAEKTLESELPHPGAARRR